MSIRIRAADLENPTEIDRIEAWLAIQSASTPFHRPAWMNAIRRAFGHDVHYLLAEEQGGSLTGVLPLHGIRSRLFGRALVSSGFAVSGGVLAETAAVAAALTEEARTLAARLDYPSIELRGGQLPGAGHGWHLEDQSYAGFERALAPDDETELKAIPRKQRAEVRKALERDMKIRIGTDHIDLKEHFSVYSESVRNLGTPVFSPRLFREVLSGFGPDADILTVSDKGSPVASVLSLYHRGVVMPYWGGGTHAARRLRANDLMYYARMRHARGRGCAIFDFGRSKVGTGAFAFKKNWGFDPQPLAYAVHSRDGAAPRAINPLNPKYRLQIALWRRLPLPVANRLGPMIARGLG